MANHRVLLLGATGHLGQHFVSALRRKNKEVVLLLRPETAATTDPAKRSLIDGFLKSGAKIAQGSIGDLASLEKACTGIDTVISAVNGPELAQQIGLATVAKKAGVRRFFASEFGLDALLAPKGSVLLLDWKRDLQAPLRATGISVTNVLANCFASYWGAGLGQLGVYSPADAVQFYGDGNVKAALVTLNDIATYTAEMIDDARTENKDVAIVPQDNLLTQSELIGLWEAKSGKKVTRIPVPAAGLDQAIAGMEGKPDKMMECIYTQLTRGVWIQGIASRKRADALEATDLYPALTYTRMSHFYDAFKK